MNVMLLVSLSDRKTLEARSNGRVDIITGTLGKPWEDHGWIYHC
jgi:hypothetical protein